jgi:hypothetical protein
MKKFVGYIVDKAVKAMPRSKKVSPDIKSVPPTKLSVKESLKKTKEAEYLKTAFQFKGVKSYHAVQPGDKKKYKIKKGIAGGN